MSETGTRSRCDKIVELIKEMMKEDLDFNPCFVGILIADMHGWSEKAVGHPIETCDIAHAVTDAWDKAIKLMDHELGTNVSTRN
jgi:hypothetical protein